MGFEVSVDGVGITFSCRNDESVLQAMASRGASCVQVGCRSGGCGVCRVQVLDGDFETGQMSREQISEADLGQRIALACQVFPRSNLRLRVLGCADSADATRILLRSLSRRSTVTGMEVRGSQPSWN